MQATLGGLTSRSPTMDTAESKRATAALLLSSPNLQKLHSGPHAISLFKGWHPSKTQPRICRCEVATITLASPDMIVQGCIWVTTMSSIRVASIFVRFYSSVFMTCLTWLYSRHRAPCYQPRRLHWPLQQYRTWYSRQLCCKM